MSEVKHTQGPWVFARANERDFHVRPTGRTMRQSTIGYRPIATVKHDKRLPESEAYANAALISAAPEMFEALKLIANAENSALDLAYCKGIARAAITKAGEKS